MKISALLLSLPLAVTVLMAGCASFGSLPPGSSMAEVEQKYHAPSGKRTEANGNQIWEYNLAPSGREFWILSFGPDGRLLQASQALTDENFLKLRSGQATREEVTRLIGPPYRIFKFPARSEEVWQYRYVRGSWYMLASMQFDTAKGVYISYSTEPDPEMYPSRETGR